MSNDREICEAATDGPWSHSGIIYSDNSTRPVMSGYDMVAEGCSKEDADYLANFNPQKVIQMLDESDADKKRIEQLEEALNHLIQLKRLKDEEGKTEFYLHQKPIAWKQAEELL